MRSLIGKIQQHSGGIVAILTVVTAGLGVLSAYYGLKAADVAQERDAVRGEATELQTQQSDLAAQVDELKGENADLRARLGAGSGGAGSGGSSEADVAYRRLIVPLPPGGDEGNLLLDRGEVTTECCEGDLTYSRNGDTAIPELTADDVPYSTDVPSAAATQEECSQAVKTSPTITPIRRLRKGALICANTEGGTSLLRISAPPRKNGTLLITQTFWPTPSG